MYRPRHQNFVSRPPRPIRPPIPLQMDYLQQQFSGNPRPIRPPFPLQSNYLQQQLRQHYRTPRPIRPPIPLQMDHLDQQPQQMYYNRHRTFNQFPDNQQVTEMYGYTENYTHTNEDPPSRKRTVVPNEIEGDNITAASSKRVFSGCSDQDPTLTQVDLDYGEETSPTQLGLRVGEDFCSTQIEPPQQKNEPVPMNAKQVLQESELFEIFSKYQPPNRSKTVVCEAFQSAISKFSNFLCGSKTQKSRKIGIEDAVGSIVIELKELHREYRHLFTRPRTMRAIKQTVRDQINSAMTGKVESWGHAIKVLYYDMFPCSKQMIIEIAQRHKGVYFRMADGKKKKLYGNPVWN